jgi:acetate kinase
MKKIFAVNAGSSSLKFQIIEMPEEEVITVGQVERIGFDDSIFSITFENHTQKTILPVKTQKDAVQLVLKTVLEMGIVKNLDEIKGVGHRVVQGGEFFDKTVVVTPEVVEKIDYLAQFAPLHNKANLEGYKAFHELLPNVIHTVVFDTAFHQTMEEQNYIFPIPYHYYKDYAIRRYGAHGTSHKYIASVVEELLGTKEYKLISCHLGSGASLCAIKNGKCIDTSMGFTPLGGIMMGTRCGDVDPSAILYMMEKENLTLAQMNHILNKESGLLGVSGRSSDMRDIDKGIAADEHQSLLAQKLYCTRVAQFIGSYFVELGGCDALVFTAGVGENSKSTRSRLLPMISEALGIEVDESQTIDVKHGQLISTKNSKVKVYIIPTNEELMIARDTYELVQQNG